MKDIEKFRAVANQFTNSVEISEQEAVYLLLKLFLHLSSRGTIFLPTSVASERVRLMRAVEELVELEKKDPSRFSFYRFRCVIGVVLLL